MLFKQNKITTFSASAKSNVLKLVNEFFEIQH